MDPIAKRILNSADLRSRRERQAQEDAAVRRAAMEASPEYQRLVRCAERVNKMFGFFKARCHAIQVDLSESKFDGQFSYSQELTTRADGSARKEGSPFEWTVTLNKGALHVSVDDVGSDEQVDLFGSMTVLSHTSLRRAFFFDPKGTFFEVRNTTLDRAQVCPHDYYSLVVALKRGCHPMVGSFEKMLDESLTDLVEIELERGLPDRLFANDTADVPHFMRSGREVRTPRDPYKELGVEVDELKKLAGTAPPSVAPDPDMFIPDR